MLHLVGWFIWIVNIYIPWNLTFTITGHLIIQMVQINQLHTAKSLLEKLKGVQIVTEFSTFNWTQTSITTGIKGCHWSQSWTRQIQPTTILMLFYHLCLVSMLYLSLRSLFSPTCAACLLYNCLLSMIAYYSRRPILHSCMLNSFILWTFHMGQVKYPQEHCILDFTPF